MDTIEGLKLVSTYNVDNCKCDGADVIAFDLKYSSLNKITKTLLARLVNLKTKSYQCKNCQYFQAVWNGFFQWHMLQALHLDKTIAPLSMEHTVCGETIDLKQRRSLEFSLEVL